MHTSEGDMGGDVDYEGVELAGAMVADAVLKLTKSVMPRDLPGGKDATGGHVECLTEAVVGVTAGLCRIADALESIAEAIRERPA